MSNNKVLGKAAIAARILVAVVIVVVVLWSLQDPEEAPLFPRPFVGEVEVEKERLCVVGVVWPDASVVSSAL